jgi:hypothetical protein
MTWNQSGPSNKRAGVHKGSAPHPVNKHAGGGNAGMGKIDAGFGYADFAKTKVGIGKDKKKG